MEILLTIILIKEIRHRSLIDKVIEISTKTTLIKVSWSKIQHVIIAIYGAISLRNFAVDPNL